MMNGWDEVEVHIAENETKISEGLPGNQAVPQQGD
jgi:hypothetical protein